MILFSLPGQTASIVSPDENVTVLNIKLCCDSCNQKLEKILKIKGLEMVAMDTEKDLVSVTGIVNMIELRSYIKGVLKKDFEVVVLAKKDTVSTEKKGRESGATGKKDKDTGVVDKKRKEVGAAEMIMREKETEPTYKKIKGIDAGAMHKKEENVKTTENRDKHSEPKGSAGVDNKSENKGNGVNQKIDGHRKIEEASSDGSSRGNNQEEGIVATMRTIPPCYHRSVDNVYDYNSLDCFVHSRPVYYSNGYDMFSDENPHSYCTIM